MFKCNEVDGIICTDDTLVFTNGGDYFGTLSISLSALPSKDFHIRATNDTQALIQGYEIGVSTIGDNSEVNVSLPLYIEANANDVIKFEIQSDDGTNPTVDDAVFYIIYLHE